MGTRKRKKERKRDCCREKGLLRKSESLCQRGRDQRLVEFRITLHGSVVIKGRFPWRERRLWASPVGSPLDLVCVAHQHTLGAFRKESFRSEEHTSELQSR